MKFYDSSISCVYENGRKLSVNSLATPIFLELVSVGMLGTINTLLLSGYNQDAVGAVGVVAQVLGLLTQVTTIVTLGMKVVAGVELGRSNRKAASEIAGTSFFAILFLSVVLGLITTCFADPILRLMNLEGNPLILAGKYMRIKTGLLFITVMKSYVTVLLTCNGYVKQASLSTVVTQIFNVILGWVVLYGPIKFPFTGVERLAIRAAVAELVGILIALSAIIGKKCPFAFKINVKDIKRILRIGVPASMNGIGYTFGQAVTTSIIASFGIDVVNAKVYVSQITMYVYYFSAAISQATAIIMGRLRGKEETEKIRRLFWQSTRMGMLLNGIATVSVFFARKPLLSLFTTSPEIIKIASTLMFIDIFVQIIRGATNVSDQSLTANADTKYVSLVSISACCGVTILFAWLLGIKLNLGIAGCWIAFVLEEAYKSSLYILRWRTGKWKLKKI